MEGIAIIAFHINAPTVIKVFVKKILPVQNVGHSLIGVKEQLLKLLELLNGNRVKEKNMKKDAFYTPYYEVKEIEE